MQVSLKRYANYSPSKLTCRFHMIRALNSFQVCLMSRDEQSILITTFAELKLYLEQSFGEILAYSSAPVKGTTQHHPVMMSSSH